MYQLFNDNYSLVDLSYELKEDKNTLNNEFINKLLAKY